MTDRWTGSASTYYAGRRRAGQVHHAHLIPPDGTFPGRSVPTAACGQPWWATANAGVENVPIAGPLPAGLTWCPKCLGVAADVLGLTGWLAAMIAEAAAR